MARLLMATVEPQRGDQVVIYGRRNYTFTRQDHYGVSFPYAQRSAKDGGGFTS
jgi:hypothetical protein